MSFNNYVDTEAAWNLVQDITETAVAIIKHTNPSGVGIGGTNLEAYQRALSTDPVSAFGGIVALNRAVDRQTAEAISQVFTEVVIRQATNPMRWIFLRQRKICGVWSFQTVTEQDRFSSLSRSQVDSSFRTRTFID